MKRFFMILGVVVVLLVAAVVALPFIVPKSTLVAFVTEQIEEATGRKVTIGGEPEFSIFPDVKLSLKQVTMANAEGGKAANMAEIGSADVEVDLMAAISGEVVVRKFVLIDPVIAIEKDKNGRFNFEFEDSVEEAKTDSSADSEEGDGALALSLGDVRLENATLIYEDAQTGERQEIRGFNAKLSLPSANGPFDMTADAEWRSRKVDIVAHIDNPNAIGAGKKTALNIKVGSDGLFDLGFEGTASAGAAPEGAGKIDLSVADVAALLAWAEVALGPDVKLPKTIAISGNMTGAPTRVALSGASISFDKNTVTGSLSAGLTGGKPFAVADLDAGQLDLRAYLPEQKAEGGSSETAAQPASNDWSDDKIDLSGLNAADADIKLKAASITTGMVDVGATDIAIVSKGKRLDVRLNRLGLYEGAASGTISVDQRKGDPVIGINLTVAGLQAHPALKQLADHGDLLGTVDLKLDLTTRGDTQRKFVSALNGSGNISITDGAILGYNLAAAMRNISTGDLDLNYDKADKTDFAEITASFTAKNGLVHNPDLKMNAPLIRLTGKGDITLPPRTIDYRALPKLVASLTGQGASEGGGLGIPILIKGSWDDPSIQPDLEGVVKGLLESPGDAVKGVTDAVKGVTDGSAVKGVTDTVKKVTEGGGGAVKGVLDAVTGGGAKTDDAPASTGSDSGDKDPISGATKKLKGLFGN